MACPVCGSQREIFVHETWAGTLHSACNHGACHDCLRQEIDQQLPRCRREGQLRIQCFHAGCQKYIPQTLTLATSVAARGLASELDHGEIRYHELSAAWKHGLKIHVGLSNVCGRCKDEHTVVFENDCGHCACEGCWRNMIEEQLPACRENAQQRPRCATCHGAIGNGLWQHVCDVSGVVGGFDRYVNSEIARLQNYARTAMRLAPLNTSAGPVCAICCQHNLALLENGVCGHAACEDCWARWAETQIEYCRIERKIDVFCLGDGCKKLVEQEIWNHTSTRSAEANRLDAHIKRRLKLKANTLFPAALQVDCPQWSCVGLGYLGNDTVMCFICEHSWAADGEPPPEDGGIHLVDGIEVKMKACPKCKGYIEENGGCDHMTCTCGFQFYWTTLKPFRNSTT